MWHFFQPLLHCMYVHTNIKFTNDVITKWRRKLTRHKLRNSFNNNISNYLDTKYVRSVGIFTTKTISLYMERGVLQVGFARAIC